MAGEVSKPIPSPVLWGGGRSPFSMSYGKMMMWFFLVSDALTFGGLLTAYGFIRHKYTDIWPAGEEVFRALPGLDGDYPLIYVALMTFILIVSSVTMVLAVEAGHRMDKKGVVRWMVATVVGGFFFVGSQAWEWYHFIHGSHEGVTVIASNALEDAEHTYHYVDAGGSDRSLTLKEMGVYFKETKKLNDAGVMELAHIKSFSTGVYIHGEEAVRLKGHLDKHHVDQIYGANMYMNEYQPQIPQYANFFFFITGFHGFHVFSGVIINLIVMIMAMRGVFHRRGHYEMIEKAGLYWHFVDLVWVFVFTFFYLV